MANPAVVVDFVANTRDLQKGFQQASGKAAGFGSKLKGIATGAAVAGFAALTASVKVGVEEFAEAQKVAAQTGAVLKSTGGAANVSAKQVGNLAEALMKKTGIDDEAIQSGENLLLTFTKVQNQAGKGNDIFNQATTVMTDLSVALGKDMTSSATLVGKALNDPVKGIGALSKAGVQFTEAQKKQIEAMVKSGDTMGAQKMILAELNTQFKGSAEAAGKTLPGQLEILKQEFSNFAGMIVEKVIPVLLKVVKILNDNRTTVIAVAAVIATITAGVLAYNAVMAAYNAVTKLATAATKAYTFAVKALNFVMRMNPIGLVITALTLLVGAFIYAYKHSETFRKIVDGAFGKVKDAAVGAVDAIKGAWNGLVGFLRGLTERIGNIVGGVVNIFKGAINAFIGAWNNLGIPGFNVNINMPSPIPDIKFGWGGLSLPDIPKLAAGGIVTRPTLAMIGEAGPEAVLPLSGGGGGIQVRVFIGDQELTSLVRTEIVNSNTGIARTLLGGAANR